MTQYLKDLNDIKLKREYLNSQQISGENLDTSNPGFEAKTEAISSRFRQIYFVEELPKNRYKLEASGLCWYHKKNKSVESNSLVRS